MSKKVTLVDALRCTTYPYSQKLDCDNCPYQLMEEVSDLVPVPADKIIDGIKYWTSCDAERMALDAANEITILKSKLRAANNKILQMEMEREKEEKHDR